MKFPITSLALISVVECIPSFFDKRTDETTLLTDLSIISRHWGQISPYADNNETYFGVEDVGLPDGCGIEQVHSLQRHAQRFPTSFYDDGANNENFAQKVLNFTSLNANSSFSGPLAFLNTYKYQMGEGYLTGIGAATEFSSGVQFWNTYGRLLYNATKGQVTYNSSYTNGTARPKPVLRTTSQSRIENSMLNWALGFFGPSFQQTPNPSLANATSPYDVVIIPEGGTENNTLASYDSCINENNSPILDMGDQDLLKYVALYLQDATKRVQAYAPKGFTFTVNDTYAMQSICAYETAYIGDSDFCGLFTADEWAGFEQTLDMEYYYDYSYGNPTGRAQGIGYLQELLARLQNEYITSSNSSVNSSLTDNSADFPLGRPFYLDASHDDIIVSVLTAMSLDYLKDPPNLSQYPPNPSRHFILSHLTPFGARLITEVIGCKDANPVAKATHSASYYVGQNGYKASSAPNKFIRMRLNSGILPLSSIRGGACAGRTDGLCPLSKFIDSQKNSTKLANYQYACFGNYTITDATSGKDYDGTIFA
ncbi:uncharacterized protein PV09_06165 [Verruconis gallopava]|uniref:3-phytase n=1 Tax=Verruconis gallopava TaxID=253628 RepID=A0A0D1XK69_9PEZI|nr:uncharacterized protein PV09_06165 [Verruconis gallopava]KIW02731.1 hypothetical protein PV09_06165 [Verruconis gallopava]